MSAIPDVTVLVHAYIHTYIHTYEAFLEFSLIRPRLRNNNFPHKIIIIIIIIIVIISLSVVLHSMY